MSYYYNPNYYHNRTERSETYSDAHNLFNNLRNSIYKKSWNVVRCILTTLVDHKENNVAGTCRTYISAVNCSSTSATNSQSSSTMQRYEGEKPYNYFTMHGIDIEDQIDLIRHMLLSSESNHSVSTTYASVDATCTVKSSCIEDIIAMLIQVLDLSSYLPIVGCASCSLGEKYDDKIFNTPILSARNPQGTSLLIELCMDSNHFGVRQLLQALPPAVASVEVQRTDYIYVEYMEQQYLQQPKEDPMPLLLAPASSTLLSSSTTTTRRKKSTSIKDFHFFHTPLQAAWEGVLYHRDEYRKIVPFIQNVNGLFVAPSSFSNSQRYTRSKHKDIHNLWRTTLHLLKAVAPQTMLSTSSSKRISSSSTSSSSWNIIHSILKLGHKAHSAVLWFALGLYEEKLLAMKDSNGDLPIHSAATNLIHYKSVRAQLNLRKSLQFYGDDIHGNKRKRKYDSFFQSDKQQEKHRSQNEIISRKSDVASVWDQPPIIHLLQYEEGRRTASVRDKKGRLPLHLLLANHDENHAQLERIHTFYEQNIVDDRNDNDCDCEKNAIPMSNKKGYAMDSGIVVRELVNAYPHSVHCIDPINGLYPFLTSASSKTIPLDVTYFLLSHKVDIFSSCVDSKLNQIDQREKKHH